MAAACDKNSMMFYACPLFNSWRCVQVQDWHAGPLLLYELYPPCILIAFPVWWSLHRQVRAPQGQSVPRVKMFRSAFLRHCWLGQASDVLGQCLSGSTRCNPRPSPLLALLMEE